MEKKTTSRFVAYQIIEIAGAALFVPTSIVLIKRERERERERERRLITIPYKKETTYLVQ